MKRVIFRQNETNRRRLPPSPDGFGATGQAALIFGVALALRLVAMFVLSDLPISRTPQLDSSAYVGWAGALVNNGSFWPVYPEHAPGYPIFMSVILSAFESSLTAVRILQSILGAIGCVLIARVASRTLTPGAFLPAGLLQAVYAPLIYIDTAILAESVFIFLLILGLDLATAATGRGRAFAAGIVLGLATIVRPTALAVVIAFAIVLLLTRIKRHATGLQLAAGFVAGALVVIAPVVVTNWRVTGVPMVQAYGGMNFYLGNRPAGTGMASARPGGEWDALEGEASRFGYGRNEQDAYYFRKTFEAIGAAPGAYAQLLGSKLLWAVQAEELRDTHSYHFFADALPMLKWLPGFGVVLALACVGFVRSSGPGRRWLLVYLGATLVTIVLLVVGYSVSATAPARPHGAGRRGHCGDCRRGPCPALARRGDAGGHGGGGVGARARANRRRVPQPRRRMGDDRVVAAAGEPPRGSGERLSPRDRDGRVELRVGWPGVSPAAPRAANPRE